MGVLHVCMPKRSNLVFILTHNYHFDQLRMASPGGIWITGLPQTAHVVDPAASYWWWGLKTSPWDPTPGGSSWSPRIAIYSEIWPCMAEIVSRDGPITRGSTACDARGGI